VRLIAPLFGAYCIGAPRSHPLFSDDAFTTFHPFVFVGSDGTFQEMTTIATARLLAIVAILVFLWNVPEVAIVLFFAIATKLVFMRARRIRSQLRKLQ
jgi:hypothetical protein